MPKQTTSKPAAKPAADAANATRERCTANRATASAHYNGPSLVAHASRAPKLADALARIATPVQRAKSATVRDESAILLLSKRADKDGTFCPVDCTADLGALSRLASLGHITVAPCGKRAALTATGKALAGNVAKRAKAAVERGGSSGSPPLPSNGVPAMRYVFSLLFGIASIVLLFCATEIAPELPVRWPQSERELAGQLLFFASMGALLTAFGFGVSAINHEYEKGVR